MALQKNKLTKGYEANYFRIIQYSANFDRNDAVITLALYKDKATRDADSNVVIESFTFDLGSGFHEVQNTKTDTVKNIKIAEAYKYLKNLAIAESLKEEKDENLAFFADAIDA